MFSKLIQGILIAIEREPKAVLFVKWVMGEIIYSRNLNHNILLQLTVLFFLVRF